MAATLLTGGAKGLRYSLPNTRILIHQPSAGFSGQATDIQIHAQEILRVRHRLDEIMAEHTGKPIEEINRDSERDFFMSAEEAKAYGIIDEIISGHARDMTADGAGAAGANANSRSGDDGDGHGPSTDGGSAASRG
jgi:ATP-dependent Clp protease protease subunit